MLLNIFKNYHPRLDSIVQWFSQVKHYMKLDKTTNLKALKDSLKSSIKKIKKNIIRIILFMLTTKITIRIKNILKYLINIENLKFIKINITRLL